MYNITKDNFISNIFITSQKCAIVYAKATLHTQNQTNAIGLHLYLRAGVSYIRR